MYYTVYIIFRNLSACGHNETPLPAPHSWDERVRMSCRHPHEIYVSHGEILEINAGFMAKKTWKHNETQWHMKHNDIQTCFNGGRNKAWTFAQTSLGSLFFCREISRELITVLTLQVGMASPRTEQSRLQAPRPKSARAKFCPVAISVLFHSSDFQVATIPVRVQLYGSYGFPRKQLCQIPPYQLGFIWCRPPRLSCHHPRSGKTRPPRLSWPATGRVTARVFVSHVDVPGKHILLFRHCMLSFYIVKFEI